ncbi:MAG: hypothetical protein AAGU75_13475, partial [Bacillota bacterium]
LSRQNKYPHLVQMRVDWKRMRFSNQQELHLTTLITLCQQCFLCFFLETSVVTSVIIPFQNSFCQVFFLLAVPLPAGDLHTITHLNIENKSTYPPHFGKSCEYVEKWGLLVMHTPLYRCV